MQIGGAGHECTEASFVDDEILSLHLKLRPQLEAMAAAAKGFIDRFSALGRRKVGEPSRPLCDCCVVNQVPDENVEATRRADSGVIRLTFGTISRAKGISTAAPRSM